VKNSIVTQNKERSSRTRLLLLRRANTANDLLLVSNLERFNLAGGWNQLLMWQQVQEFNR
jgi:hypothetical protein